MSVVMNKNDFYYDLPEELIAQTPVEPRDSSGLLVYDRSSDIIEHKHFYDLPDYLKKYAETFGISKEKINDAASKASEDKTENISDKIAESTVKPVVVKALSGIISAAMFAILFFLIKILSRLINGMFNISFVGSINRLLGGLLGLVKGMIFAALFILIINFLVVISKGSISYLSEDMINESIFFKLFSNLIK